MKIVIRFDGSEYRVPGPEGTEAQACYTDDKEDAIGTAKAVFGPNIKFSFRRVDCADPDMEYWQGVERTERDNMI